MAESGERTTMSLTTAREILLEAVSSPQNFSAPVLNIEQHFSDQPQPAELPSSDIAFHGIVVIPGHQSSSNESFMGVVENSIRHKAAYERDLVNMMMFSCERRFKWKSNFEFFIAAISFLIGYDAMFSFLRTFGRVGITIVVPFSVLLFCYGIPVMYLEMALGQYCSTDSSLIFKRMVPALSAIGYLSWTVSFFAVISSQSIMVLCTDLIVTSLSMLRDNYVFFETCHKFYNTEDCLEIGMFKKCTDDGDLYYNGGCLRRNSTAETLRWGNKKEILAHAHRQKEPSAQYLQIFLGGFVDGWIPSNPSVNVVLWLVVSWMVLAIVARKGIEFVLKMSYATITALLLMVVMLFLIGIAAGGMWPSLDFFFKIRMEHVYDPIVWLDTFVYISVCMKLGQGGLITLGSYNDFHANIFRIYRNMLIVVISSFWCPILAALSLTPLYSAFVNNLLLGQLNDHVKFTEALNKFHEYEGVSMTASSLMMVQTFCGAFIAIFAMCVFFLNLGNQMMRINLLMSSLREHFHVFVDPFYMDAMIIVLCTIGCLLNFIFFTPYGSSFFVMVSQVILPLICSATGMLEALAITYAYGSKKMFTNITAMLFGVPGNERRIGLWKLVPYFNGCMMICWKYLTPFVVALCILGKLAAMVDHWHEQMLHRQISMILSVIITYLILAFVPFHCVLRLCMAHLEKKPCVVMFRPHLLLFGPRKPKDRRLARRVEERFRVRAY